MDGVGKGLGFNLYVAPSYANLGDPRFTKSWKGVYSDAERTRGHRVNLVDYKLQN